MAKNSLMIAALLALLPAAPAIAWRVAATPMTIAWFGRG